MATPRYRCLTQLAVTPKRNGVAYAPIVYGVGDEIEYDGLPSANLEPLNDEAKRRREEADDLFARQRVETRLKQNQAAQDMLVALMTLMGGAGAQPTEAAKARGKAA